MAQDPAYRAEQARKQRGWRAAHPNHKPVSGERKAILERVKAGPTKFCATCGETKPRTAFGRLSNGWRSRCNPCAAAKQLERHNALKNDPEYRAKNAAKTREWHARNPGRRTQFHRAERGWPPELFEVKWIAQDGKCAICGRQLKKTGKGKDAAHADHNHDTGEPRDILCHGCNTGIGALGDSPERCDAAARYLRRFP